MRQIRSKRSLKLYQDVEPLYGLGNCGCLTTSVGNAVAQAVASAGAVGSTIGKVHCVGAGTTVSNVRVTGAGSMSVATVGADIVAVGATIAGVAAGVGCTNVLAVGSGVGTVVVQSLVAVQSEAAGAK